MKSDGGKRFASFCVLTNGIAFFSIMAVITVPMFHRIMHRFDLEDDDVADDERPDDERPDDERPDDERPDDERPDDEHRSAGSSSPARPARKRRKQGFNSVRLG